MPVLTDLHTDTRCETLVLERFFAGRVRGRGAFVNAWTRARRELTIDITCHWDGKVLILDEDFLYADGAHEHMIWRLEQTGPGTFSGTRDDVIGTARLWTEGPAVRLQYKLRLAGTGFDFSEKMRLFPDGKVRTRAWVRKWGIPVGTVDLVIEPV